MTSASWSQERWAPLLDRVELRQQGIGLRFWGPPLWLEVTMNGPDSDRWPSVTPPSPYDWQSNAVCEEAEALVGSGADDDRVLEAVARYTLANVVLNAVHEIGEWFRFDGRRLFPAHPSVRGAPADAGQGNGSVLVTVDFPAQVPSILGARQLGEPEVGYVGADELGGRRRLRRLADGAGPASRYTYVPATTVGFEVAGPTVRWHATGAAPSGWQSTWSAATIDALGRGGSELVASVRRDVHAALVFAEADRACRAFYIDGRRPWQLVAPGAPLDHAPHERDAAAVATVAVSHVAAAG